MAANIIDIFFTVEKRISGEGQEMFSANLFLFCEMGPSYSPHPPVGREGDGQSESLPVLNMGPESETGSRSLQR
jgi:hypothetical protein